MGTIKFRMKFILFVMLLSVCSSIGRGIELTKNRREVRKLFGGYRITPKQCVPTRISSNSDSSSVCMFNHECSQRNGEVVGTCMDGFLFGACCQLPDALVGELTINDYPAIIPSNNLGFFQEKISSKHPSENSYHTPPADNIALDGFSKITEELLKPNTVLTAEQNESSQIGNFHAQFTTTGITHPSAPDTIILNENDENNIIYSDVFNKPVNQKISPEDRQTTFTLPETTPTYLNYGSPFISISISNTPLNPEIEIKKPLFRPKPSQNSDKYVLVPTVTHKPNKSSEVTIDESIPATSTTFFRPSSSLPIKIKTELTQQPTKVTTVSTTKTSQRPSTSYIYSSTLPPRPIAINTKPNSQSKPTKWTSYKPFTTIVYGSTNKPPLQKISTSTSKPSIQSIHTTHKSPSTSHVYSTSFSKQPLIVSDSPSSFYSSFSQHPSSSTAPPPTIIVLGPSETYSSPSSPPSSSYSSTNAPVQRPVTHVTINNHVTHAIYPSSSSYSNFSPSVLITPKPNSITSKPLKKPTTEFVTTGESETSLNNDLINFPPVRNPNLNISAPIEDDLTTPTFIEDDVLNLKVESFVNNIVEGLQEPFNGLKDFVYKQNSSFVVETSTKKSNKKPATTKKPISTTKRTTTRKTSTITPTRKQTTTTTNRPTPLKKLTTSTSPSLIEETSPPLNTNDYRYVCGIRPLVKTGRIVGGKAAAFGEFPWQVLVRESTWLGLFTKNKCGGVLISKNFVITAAHCQPGFLASLVAVFGDHDISGDKEKKRAITRNVKRVIVHREYDPLTFENDLALLELENPVAFDEHIVPICLPQEGADFTGRMATVTGWGRLKYGGAVPSVLQEVQVPIMENHVCQEMFKTAHHDKKIRESFLCAGYANGQKDSCEGDSGGPLVLQRPDGRWELAGTVSHGIKCAAPYLPGVYMRTAYYKPWLESITGVH